VIGKPQSKRRSAWAFMERFEVPDLDHPERTYLSRLRIIQTPWCALYLHRLDTPDSRPTLHDHPWSFVSLILRGGYDEQRLDLHTHQLARKRRRWVNVMRRDDAHYIERLFRVPTWTLLFVGARRRTWGYWRPVGNSGRGAWYWTPFDRDVHAEEFDAAMAQRRAS
jgi:hypothetical protein